MASRTPLGAQQRAPQRTLSGPGLSQRQAHQRSLSQHQQQQQQPPQQHLPSPPARRDFTVGTTSANAATTSTSTTSTSILDQSPSSDSGGDGTGPQGRYGALKRGGSRLRLELSHDSGVAATDSIIMAGVAHAGFIESPGALNGSKPVTPSRVMPPMTDSSEQGIGDMSPSSQAPTTVDGEAPVPMPPRRKRFVTSRRPRNTNTTATTTTTSTSTTSAAASRKDMRMKPYTIERPAAAPRYPVRGRKTEPTAAANARAKAAAAAAAANNTTRGASAAASAAMNLMGSADFFPWNGQHAEDHFSENVIRQGYFDKAPIAQTETASAKVALQPSIKHKVGVTTLSTVFTGILAQRKNSGEITAPSSFKPPPRVTLTDTKRENWLKDLSNPAVPLRKLSRTIPHGIRGRALLEHCLAKSVPSDRAVWLVRCVGANEIRASKRKGINGTIVMGGEQRWIKDWTLSIEQFAESIITIPDQQQQDGEWKTKAEYVMRLISHIYAEQLLDRDHFMEWLVSSLENSGYPMLPFWLVATKMYWTDLLRLRRHGRRVVATIVRHLHQLYIMPDNSELGTLSSMLFTLVTPLVSDCPQNFIALPAWSAHRASLRAWLPAADEVVHDAFTNIELRNDQLAGSSVPSEPGSRHLLVPLLDSALRSAISDTVPTECWHASNDKQALPKTVLEWATSMYRPTPTKTYVAARFLTTWASHGVDVTTVVLDFMDSGRLVELPRKEALYHLVSELIPTEEFSVARYMKWLVARGGMSRAVDAARDGACATRLLAEIPLHALSDSLRRTRDEMLRRASYDTDKERQDISLAISYCKHALGMPLGAAEPIFRNKPIEFDKLQQRIKYSSRVLKAGVGDWVRAVAAAHVQYALANPGTREPSVDTFGMLRSLLEAAEEFSTLADVLKVMARVSNVELLASCADTVNSHLPIFAALTVSSEIFDLLYTKLKALVEDQGIFARQLLAALAALAPRMPTKMYVAAQLKRDLEQSYRDNPVDASSPVSDNMASHLRDDDSELQEELEKRLAAGMSMDSPTMDRFFQIIVTRLEAFWGKSRDEQQAYSALLARLRYFDTQHFDTLMTKWLVYVRSTSNRPSILRIYPLLVNVGCLTMAMILAAADTQATGAIAGQNNNNNNGTNQIPGSTGPQSLSPAIETAYRMRYMQETLLLFLHGPLEADGLLALDERYRFQILKYQERRENTEGIINLIRSAFAEYSYCRSTGDKTSLPLDADKNRDQLRDLLSQLVVKDWAGVAKALMVRSPDPTVSQLIDYLTLRLLVPTANRDTTISFEQIFALTDQLTLPFCQLKLTLSLAHTGDDNPDATDRLQSHIELFANAMDKAVEAKNITWTGMLTSLSPEITQHLKNRAQGRFLGLLPTPKNPPTTATAPSFIQHLQTAQNLLSVMEVIIHGGSLTRSPQLAAATVEKLADLWELLATPSVEAGLKQAILAHWLPLLLQFVALHAGGSVADPSRAGNEIRAKVALQLAGLMQEVESHQVDFPVAGASEDTHMSNTPVDGSNSYSLTLADLHRLSTRIFDLAVFLVDHTSDEARAACVRAVQSATSDHRVRYLFSVPPPVEPQLYIDLSDEDGDQQLPDATPAGQSRLPQPPATPAMSSSVPAAAWAAGMAQHHHQRLAPFVLRRWELLSEPTPAVGENDTALNLTLFDARRVR